MTDANKRQHDLEQREAQECQFFVMDRRILFNSDHAAAIAEKDAEIELLNDCIGEIDDPVEIDRFDNELFKSHDGKFCDYEDLKHWTASYRKEIKKKDAEIERLKEALEVARGGCGSLMFLASNKHNHASNGFLKFLEAAEADGRRGYEAATKALATDA